MPGSPSTSTPGRRPARKRPPAAPGTHAGSTTTRRSWCPGRRPRAPLARHASCASSGRRRRITIRSRELHEALASARAEQTSAQWKARVIPRLDAAGQHTVPPATFSGMAMPLTGHRASPTAVTLTAPSGPGWRHRRRDRPERRACAALRDTRAVPGPAARRVGDPVQARECATTQGSEMEDRSGAPAELAARFSAATRTQPHESSRSAGAIRSHPSADVRKMRCPIFMHLPGCSPCRQRSLIQSCRLYRRHAERVIYR